MSSLLYKRHVGASWNGKVYMPSGQLEYAGVSRDPLYAQDVTNVPLRAPRGRMLSAPDGRYWDLGACHCNTPSFAMLFGDEAEGSGMSKGMKIAATVAGIGIFYWLFLRHMSGAGDR